MPSLRCGCSRCFGKDQIAFGSALFATLSNTASLSLRHRGAGRKHCRRRLALDIVEQTAATRVIAPGDEQAAQIKDEERPERRLCAARQGNRGAVALRDEEGTIGGDCRGEADDGCRFLVALLRLLDA